MVYHAPAAAAAAAVALASLANGHAVPPGAVVVNATGGSGLGGGGGTRNYKFGAIYFGDWHVDPVMSALHGPNWTEWNLVTHATPRYPGHLQPNTPLDTEAGFGPSAPENVPANMEIKINAAKANGIDYFMFDWYWYVQNQTRGAVANASDNGNVFLAGALEDGFLRAANRNDMEFALMWANQDWVDVHPAKVGWHNTYRAPNTGFYCDQPSSVCGPSQLQIFDGYLNNNPAAWEAALDYVVDTYFSQLNYLQVETPVAGAAAGAVERCCWFSFYQIEYFVAGVGGEAPAAAMLQRFRQRTAKQAARLNADRAAGDRGVCGCVNLGGMGGRAGSPGVSNLDSMSDYGWIKTVHADVFPETPFEDIVEHGIAAWADRTAAAAAANVSQYLPPLSTAWDSSPRTMPSDPFLADFGYPWGAAWHSTPDQFLAAMQRCMPVLQDMCDWYLGNHSGFTECPPALINAWNEWSEGAYLEPDVRYGFGKLNAIGATFGAVPFAPKTANH